MLAAAFAGAAVSSVGGGDCGGEEELEQEQEQEKVQRGKKGRSEVIPPSSPAAALLVVPRVCSEAPLAQRSDFPGDASVTTATSISSRMKMTTTAGSTQGRSGSAGRDDGREEVVVAEDDAGVPWFVPSGALGGAFYALTAGGVFGGVMREYILGGGWFSSPDSVRTALGIVFLAVYLLRSLPGRGDGKFNPVAPCYRLLGLSERGGAPPANAGGKSAAAATGTAAGAAAGAADPGDTPGLSPGERTPPMTRSPGGSNDGKEETEGVSMPGRMGRRMLQPSRVSALRGQTRAGAGAVDLRAMLHGFDGCNEEDGDSGRQANEEREGLVAIGVARVKLQEQQQQQQQLQVEARGESFSTLATTSSTDGEAAVGVLNPERAMETMMPRRLVSKKEESFSWWRGTGGGARDVSAPRGGGSGPVVVPDCCHPSWRLPSPATAAAAAAAGVAPSSGS
ncbi:unnamed protein product, partial [Pylaiella littoralis]